MHYNCVVESLYYLMRVAVIFEQSRESFLCAIIPYWAYWLCTGRVFYAAHYMLALYIDDFYIVSIDFVASLSEMWSSGMWNMF